MMPDCNDPQHQTADRQPLLAVRDLSVTYHGFGGDVAAVRELSFDIGRGEAVGLVGESGSGKSTVALALTGLLPQRSTTVSGTAEFDDLDLISAGAGEMRAIRGKRIGMIFQDPMTSLNPYLSVGRQVMETPVAHGVATRNARALTLDLLTAMHVPVPNKAFSRYPHQYSGGMRQRVMAASAFSGDPCLLIADEPTTALDVITQDRVLRLMKKELRQRGMSLLLITHDLGIVAGICDRVVVMKAGRAVEIDTVGRLYGNPRHAYTQALLAAVPRVDTVGGMRNEAIHCRNERAENTADRSREGSHKSPPSRRVVCVRDVEVVFRSGKSLVKAVDGVSFDVMKGEILGLVGESGSGKSTLARAIAGLIPRRAGVITVGGTEVNPANKSSLQHIRRRTQLVFQDPRASLNSRLTAERIIAEPLVNFRIAHGKEAIARARSLMEMVGLPKDWGLRYPHELSGGQCQRIGIARALAVSPDLLLCDEPVSALDVSIQADILELLGQLRKKLSLSLLFISHDLAVVRNFADRVAVMQKGRIVELTDAKTIYDAPRNGYTKALLSAVPIPDPTKYRVG